jgi:hypothetical protein
MARAASPAFWFRNGSLISDLPLAVRTAGSGESCLCTRPPRTTCFVKGFGRLRTKASSAGTRGPHALVYG